ncbi:MAG: hypothetical protein VW683_17690 [Betaproteobacteria bacterium]
MLTEKLRQLLKSNKQPRRHLEDLSDIRTAWKFLRSAWRKVDKAQRVNTSRELELILESLDDDLVSLGYVLEYSKVENVTD